MPVENNEIIELLCTLAEEEKLRVTIKESVRGGIIAGLSAAAGGLVLGPIGLAIAATIGGCFAAATAEKFSSIGEVIKSMSDHQRDALANNVMEIIHSVNVTDIFMFTAIIAENATVRDRVDAEIIQFLKNEVESGGTLGGVLAAIVSHNKFLPAVEVIATMAPHKRDALAENVRRIILNVKATDIAVFAAMIAGDVSVRNKVITTLVDYLRTEMAMKIVDH